MSIPFLLASSTKWLALTGLVLGITTIIAFFINWGAKFRLVGATIFSLLLSGSCWAFAKSYVPPLNIEGAKYVPTVFDNGNDLVVAQAKSDFPDEAIQPSLEKLAGSLKGGGRNGAKVKVRLRKVESVGQGISKPIIIGEVVRDLSTNTTETQPEKYNEQ